MFSVIYSYNFNVCYREEQVVVDLVVLEVDVEALVVAAAEGSTIVEVVMSRRLLSQRPSVASSLAVVSKINNACIF